MHQKSVSPLRLALLLAASILTAEFSLMILLRFFPALSALQVASADALVLVMVLSPALYFLLYQPLRRQVEAQRIVEGELRFKNRELDLFVENAAHCLRSSLNPITGSAWYLREKYAKNFTETDGELMSLIEEDSRKVLDLIDDLLSLARLRKEDIPQDPLDAEEVVRGVIRGLERENGGPVSIMITGALPRVSLPRNLLGVVVENLLRNAVRYGAKEGTSIEIFGDRQDGRTSFFVRDHGAGVPEDERERIFEVLYRGARTRHLPGTGVGLALVHKIVQLYGGRIWVEDTPGGGATFSFELRGD